MKVREDVSQLELRLSDESLELIEEYNQRIEVSLLIHFTDRAHPRPQGTRWTLESYKLFFDFKEIFSGLVICL